MEESSILLTIWCSAYNMCEYIKDTFEGFLSQKTKFAFRVIVFDDASTDGTSDIIRDYANRYPDIFVPYISEVNTYSNIEERRSLFNNLFHLYHKGKYVAECEGDDYWIDPYKLQKQVDFLETHPECSLTVHAARWIDYVNNNEFISPIIDESRFLDDWEVIAEVNGRPQTASFVYRADDWVIDPKLKLRDWGEYQRRVYEFSKGKVFYFKEPMSVYRFRRPGSWTSSFVDDNEFSMRSQIFQQNFFENYDFYTGYKYHRPVSMMFNAALHDSYLLDPSCSMSEYWKILSRYNLSVHNLNNYKEDRERIGSIVRNSYIFSAEEIDLISNNKYVVVYGCGKCSAFLKNILKSNNIPFDGYLVSDGKKTHEELEGKKIWEICEYPNSFDNTVVIMGLGQETEYSVRNILQKYGVSSIIDSFWVKNSRGD